MTKTTDIGREHAVPRLVGEGRGLSAVEDWFVQEVLPLEEILMQFLRRHCRNETDVDDLCQDIYVRVYEAAHKEVPAFPRAFVLALRFMGAFLSTDGVPRTDRDLFADSCLFSIRVMPNWQAGPKRLARERRGCPAAHFLTHFDPSPSAVPRSAGLIPLIGLHPTGPGK